MTDPFQNPFLESGTGDENGHGVIGGGTLRGLVKTGQIITVALAIGLVFMTLVLTYMTLSSAAGQQPAGVLPGEGDDLILPGLGVVVAFGSCMAAAVVPPIVRRAGAAKFQARGETVDLNQGSELKITPALQQLLGSSFAAMLIGQALLEGAAAVNLIFMLLDGHLFHLGIVAVCLIGIVLQIPTEGKLLATIEKAARR